MLRTRLVRFAERIPFMPPIPAVRTYLRYYPTMSDGVEVTAGVGDWERGETYTLIPAGSVPAVYRVDVVMVERCGSAANLVYELELDAPSSEYPLTTIRFTRSGRLIPINFYTVQPGEDLVGRLAVNNSNPASRSATFSFGCLYGA